MNKIEAIYERSEYVLEPHLVIKVDGISIDEILHKEYPDRLFLGLVPTLLDWIEDPEERKIVWDRIENESKSIVPILMCPDDCDLWCTVINVEVEKSNDIVRWNKLGVDQCNSDNMPFSIGSNVEWLNRIGAFEFNSIEYAEVIGKFKEEIRKDEIKILIQSWMNRIDTSETINRKIIAFNFGIFKSEEAYTVYLIGSSKYDINDDDWSCNVEFEPKEKYLSLGKHSSNRSWQEIASIVKSGVEEFIRSRLSPLTFLHTAEYLTVGFDEGELVKIEKST